MTEVSNVEKIVAERDYLYDILMRFVQTAYCYQHNPRATTPAPTKQNLYCIAVSDEDHRRLQDLGLRIALGRPPTKTPLTLSKEN